MKPQHFFPPFSIDKRKKKKWDSHTKGRGRGRDARGTCRGGYGGRTNDIKSQGDTKPKEPRKDNGNIEDYGKGRGFNDKGRG